MDTLSDVWPVQPPSTRLHIFVEPPAGGGNPTLVQMADSLRLVTLPSRATTATTSTQTHPYDTLSVLISDKDFPFVAIKLQDMASSMVKDLFGRVLSGYPIANQSSLDRAETLASLSTQGEEGIVLVVEDKSPKVFGRHCTEEKFDGLCGTGVLHMHSTETGLWSIFFKTKKCKMKKEKGEGEGERRENDGG
ncbi:hypothetical protein BC827DRAFT_1386065 [Russula dissimulans]|nr:hypothetical protein BC827DRAFT_1386065 [Russula dissimulans]